MATGLRWLRSTAILLPSVLVLAIGLALQPVSIIVLLNIGAGSHHRMAWVHAVTTGMGIGSRLPSMSMLVNGYCELGCHGAIYGAITIPHPAGSAIVPLVAGRMYDAWGSYHQVFIRFVVLYVVSIATTPATLRPSVR